MLWALPTQQTFLAVGLSRELVRSQVAIVDHDDHRLKFINWSLYAKVVCKVQGFFVFFFLFK